MTYEYEETEEFNQYSPSDDSDSKRRRLATVAVGALLAGAVMVWIGVILTGGNSVGNASQRYGTVGVTTSSDSVDPDSDSDTDSTDNQAIYPDPKGNPASPAGKPKPSSKSAPKMIDDAPTSVIKTSKGRVRPSFPGGSAIVVTWMEPGPPTTTDMWPDDPSESPGPTPTGPLDTGNEPPYETQLPLTTPAP